VQSGYVAWLLARCQKMGNASHAPSPSLVRESVRGRASPIDGADSIAAMEVTRWSITYRNLSRRD